MLYLIGYFTFYLHNFYFCLILHFLRVKFLFLHFLRFQFLFLIYTSFFMCKIPIFIVLWRIIGPYLASQPIRNLIQFLISGRYDEGIKSIFNHASHKVPEMAVFPCVVAFASAFSCKKTSSPANFVPCSLRSMTLLLFYP